MNARRGPAALSILVAAILSGCASVPLSAAPSMSASSGTDRSGGSTRTSEVGRVTVSATWRGVAAGAAFDIRLDTHSVDLDGITLSDAVLRNDRGETLTAPTWAAPAGGHHREGTLAFAGVGSSFFDGATWIELVLGSVGDGQAGPIRWEMTR